MTVLVTGSAGHLGEALMRALRAAGRAARGLDLLASPWTDAVGSIGDPAFVAEQMADAVHQRLRLFAVEKMDRLERLL